MLPAIAVALLATCADPPQRPVLVRFAAGIDPASIALLELSLVPGGCGLQGVDVGASPSMPLRTERLERPGDGGSLGEIGSGRHYVYVRAFSDGCDVVAAGCTDTDVGTDADDAGEEVVIELEPVPGPRCGSGCDADCEPVDTGCGDGVLGLEQCDDGNVAPGDGCDSACLVERGFDCTDAEPSRCTPSG